MKNNNTSAEKMIEELLKRKEVLVKMDPFINKAKENMNFLSSLVLVAIRFKQENLSYRQFKQFLLENGICKDDKTSDIRIFEYLIEAPTYPSGLRKDIDNLIKTHHKIGKDYFLQYNKNPKLWKKIMNSLKDPITDIYRYENHIVRNLMHLYYDYYDKK